MDNAKTHCKEPENHMEVTTRFFWVSNKCPVETDAQLVNFSTKLTPGVRLKMLPRKPKVVILNASHPRIVAKISPDGHSLANPASI